MSHTVYKRDINAVILKAFVSLALTSLVFGCESTLKTDEPIRIVADRSLNVKVGDDVTWTFKAYRGRREVMVVEAISSGLPLGVIRNFEAKVPTLSGKVLSRDFRHGLIRVTAFDEKACTQAYQAMKKVTTERVAETKNTDVTIPASPCDPVTVSPVATPPEFLSVGDFAWHMVDGPDQITVDDYGSFFSQYFAVAGKNPTKLNFIPIPEREAPHTVDVTLGSCAAKERRLCGSSPDCLWGWLSCISKDATGATSSNSSNEKGKI